MIKDTDMQKPALFLPAKTLEYGSQSILEHGLQVMAVGRFLYDRLTPDFDRNQYLWACLFHDVGKIVAPPGSGKPHGPETVNGMAKIRHDRHYRDLLNRFHLDDYSGNERLIRTMADHHDLDQGARGMSIHISAADMIASGAVDRSDTRMNPALVAYLNQRSLRQISFPEVSVFNASKNEFLSSGRAIMLKLLVESIEKEGETQVLYIHPAGCRLATDLTHQQLRGYLSARFGENLNSFLASQNVRDFLVGSAGGYSQFLTFPEVLREATADAIVMKYATDIVMDAYDLRSKRREADFSSERINELLNELGLSLDILKNLCQLDELNSIVTNLAGTKLNLLGDGQGHIDPEIALRNDVKESNRVKYVENTEPQYISVLIKAGAKREDLTKCFSFESKLTGLCMAAAQFAGKEPAPDFELSDYLSIDGMIPLPGAGNTVCANCGSYPGEVHLSMIAFREQQHMRESIFKLSNSAARKGFLKVCRLCNLQALLNTFLSGVEYDRQYARIKSKTHLLVTGVNLKLKIAELLISEGETLFDRLSKGYRILEQHIITDGPNGFEMVAISFADTDSRIANRTYRKLLFSDIADCILQNVPGVLSISINCLPEKFDPTVIQMEDGNYDLILDQRLTFFRWVEHGLKLFLRNEQKRDYILRYAHQPLIGLNQLIRREKRNWSEAILSIQEELDTMVEELNAEEKSMYELAAQTWNMARLAGELSTGKNVGAFIKCFRGKPEDMDRLVNGLLKNEKISSEKRAGILDLHESLRNELEKMNDRQKRDFSEYLQKTKYLFNTKMWLIVKSERKVDSEAE